MKSMKRIILSQSAAKWDFTGSDLWISAICGFFVGFGNRRDRISDETETQVFLPRLNDKCQRSQATSHGLRNQVPPVVVLFVHGRKWHLRLHGVHLRFSNVGRVRREDMPVSFANLPCRSSFYAHLAIHISIKPSARTAFALQVE